MLYIVATPIGHLSDISIRALEVLRSVDMIICEDTRQSKKILDHYNIHKPLLSYHHHSPVNRMNEIISELTQGKNIALITDAGTPGISDPGNILVASTVEKGIYVIPIPGASAVTAALSVSGFPSDRFTFYGFLPHKKGKQTLLKNIADNYYTCIFYESTHRILKTLESLKKYIQPSRKVVVCRELTKKFESIYRGTIDEVLEQLKADTTKGEFVVIVSSK